MNKEREINKNIFFLSMIVAVPLFFSPLLRAQIMIDAGLQPMDETEIEESIEKLEGKKIKKQQKIATTESVNRSQISKPNQKVYIYNNQPVQTDVDVKLKAKNEDQSANTLAASSSMANRFRNLRKQAEQDTERRIVERLETSRLEDEESRAERLFGKRWEKVGEPTTTKKQIKVPEDAPPAVKEYYYKKYPHLRPQAENTNSQVEKTVVVIKKEETIKEPIVPAKNTATKKDVVDAKEDIIYTMRENMSRLEEQQEYNSREKTFYIGGHLGAGNYLNTYNMTSSVAAGFSLGYNYTDQIMFEGEFTYSSHEINDPRSYHFRLQEMDQYNTSFLAKYSLLKGKLRPIIGAGLSYAYRNYSETTQIRSHRSKEIEDYAQTNALDFVAYLGAEYELTERISLGFNYKYLTNLSNWSSGSYFYENCKDCTPVEELSNSQYGIHAKFRF